MSTSDRLRALIVPLVDDAGLELYDLDQSGPTLQVLVSRPGGVDVDALSRLSRAISRTLDEHDPIPGKYLLEVSSPGLERPLRRPEHYQGAVDTEVTIKTVAGTEGDRRVRGVLVAADDESATVRLADDHERRIEYRDIERARTVFEWEATSKEAAKARPQGPNSHASRAVTTAPTPRSGT
jgi:ribosome maturation factor RimP